MGRAAVAAAVLLLTGAVQQKRRVTDSAGVGEVLDLLEQRPAEKLTSTHNASTAGAGEVLYTRQEPSAASLLATAAHGAVRLQGAPAAAPSVSITMKAFGPNAHVSNTATFFNLIAIAFGIAYHCFGIPDVGKFWSKSAPEASDAALAESREALAPAKPAAPPETITTSAPPREEGAKPPVRSAGLDNLKLLLTVLVLEQHTIQCFSTGASFWFNLSLQGSATLPGGTKELPSYAVDNYFASVFVPWFCNMNQSFFMALFFFISGYFNPSSLDKKGREAFLKDKFIRLGLPCLFWHFCMGPFWAYAKLTLTTPVDNAAAWYGQTYGGLFFQSGPPWFIMWLLNFNVMHAFADGVAWKMPFPGVGPLLLFAFGAGVFQSAVPPGDFFIECPLGLHSLSLYAAFFVLGILAKRGAWVDALIQLDNGTVTFLRCLALASAGAMYVAKSAQAGLMISGDVSSDEYLSVESFVYFLMGFQCVILSAVLLHFCMTSWTQSSLVSPYAMPAAYTVYLIHPFFVVYGVAAYAQALRVMGVGVETFVGAGPPGYVVESTSVVYMWMGFAFVSLFCLGTWPMAYALAKAPGLRNVL